MLTFLTGDELGSIKKIQCVEQNDSPEWNLEAHSLRAAPSQIGAGTSNARAYGIQHMAMSKDAGHPLLAAARINGTVSTFQFEDKGLAQVKEFQASHFRPNHRFVGLDNSPSGLFWCTSNGALGYSAFAGDNTDEEQVFSGSEKHTALPMRLRDWKLDPSCKTFAYGGDEVDLSVWDVERALNLEGNDIPAVDNAPTLPSSKKRRKAQDLFPAEVWRAKNLPNDSLNLRQPIQVTSLTYLASGEKSNAGNAGVHLATGTASGAVRRYDTRAARRPVANWADVAKNGAIGFVEAGTNEHELFASDNGSHLCALDLRNGRVLYSYKKIQGTVTSLAAREGAFLGSTSRDRYFRLHSTTTLPDSAGSAIDNRGENIGSLYMKTIPTVIVAESFDARSQINKDVVAAETRDESTESSKNEDKECDEDIWNHMEDVEDSDEEESHKRARKS